MSRSKARRRGGGRREGRTTGSLRILLECIIEGFIFLRAFLLTQMFSLFKGSDITVTEVYLTNIFTGFLI